MIIYYLFVLIVACLGVRFSHFNKNYLSRNTVLSINGFFVLMIIARHFSGYAVLDNTYLDKPFFFIDEIFGQLIVVSFLFFSGYGIIYSILNKDRYLHRFPLSRILFLYCQFAVCVLLFLLTSFIPNIGTTYATNDILLSFVGWRDIGNSNWFAFVIIVQYIIVFICFRFLNKKKIVAGLCFSTILSIFLLIILYKFKPSHWYNTLLCFNLGMWYGAFKTKIDLVMKKPINYWAITVSVFLSFVALFLVYYLLDIDTVFIAISLLFALLIVFVSMKLKTNNLVLLVFGAHAFSIYMLQRLPFILLQKHFSNPYIYFIVCFLITIVLAILFDFVFSGFKLGKSQSKNPFRRYMKNLLFQAKSYILTSRILINKTRIRFKAKCHRKINVVFLIQYPEMWNSEKSVFERLLFDSSFNTNIIAVPKSVLNGLQKGMKQNYFFEKNDAYDYLSKEYSNVINSFTDGFWFNLKKLKPDVVFVQRPYQDNLPKCYSFEKISRKSLLCYVPYDGADFSREKHVAIGLNEKLVQNCAFFFSATCVHKAYFEKNKYSMLSESFYVGCPRFDLIKNYRDKEKKKSNCKTFLWLPRWYFEKGSNNPSSFLKYIDVLFDLFSKRDDACLIIRPHPLMFSKLVESKLMNQNELDNLIKKINETKNMRFDKNINYLDSFDNADYLISDLTSLLIEFFMFDKPILYCDSKDDFNDLGLEVSKSFISISNSSELALTINSILNDSYLIPKADDELLKRLCEELSNSAERVCGTLKREFNIKC